MGGCGERWGGHNGKGEGWRDEGGRNGEVNGGGGTVSLCLLGEVTGGTPVPLCVLGEVTGGKPVSLCVLGEVTGGMPVSLWSGDRALRMGAGRGKGRG